MTKSNEGENAKRRKEIKRLMWLQVYHELMPLTIGGAALLVSSYSNQAVPALVGRLIDPAASRSSNDRTSFKQSIVWVGLLGGAASFLRTLMLNQAKESIAARLRKAAFASLMTGHDLQWFQDEMAQKEESSGNEDLAPKTTPSTSLGMTPGAINTIMNDDVEAVASTMTTTLANLLRSSSSMLFSSFNMVMLNPNLFGLALAVAPAVGSIALVTRKYIKKIVAIQQEEAVKAASFVEERLNHIEMVKMSNRENDEIDSYSQMQNQLVSLGSRSAFANGLSMGTMFFLSTSALCGIMFSGGRAVEAKKMGHGQLVSFGTYSFLLALGSAGLVKAMGEFQRGRQAAERLYRLIGMSSVEGQDETLVDKNVDVACSSTRELRLDNLHFSYRSDPTTEVLQNVSLKLSRGEVVALVGKNGSGKTTIAKILAGLIKPTSGYVLVQQDGAVASRTIDYIRDLGRASQAKLVQVVPQNPAIFGTTILENIKYTRPEASEQDMMEALKASNVDTFLSKLDGGLMYQVGRNGTRLSGGQRQRLGLARALLANPLFLVLDEPASSLDAEGETAVVDAIKACRESDRALLVITHRAKTVKLADRVVVLKDGKVEEQGTLSQLQKQGGELVNLMQDLKQRY